MGPRWRRRFQYPPSCTRPTAAPEMQFCRPNELWALESWQFARRYHHHQQFHPHHQHQQSFPSCENGLDYDHLLCHDEPLCLPPYATYEAPNGQLAQATDLLYDTHASALTSTYMSLLKTCIKYESPGHARQVYAHLTMYCTLLPPSVEDYLAITLAKCGAIDDACKVFLSLRHRTVLSWTAMISAFTDAGCLVEPLEIFWFMQEDGVEPDSYTFVNLFKACRHIMDLKQGKRLHAIANEKGLTSNVFVQNTLMSMYGKCKDVFEAEVIFDTMLIHSIVSWNVMLSVYVEDGQAVKALWLCRQMLKEQIDFDQLTITLALKACVGIVKMGTIHFVEEQVIGGIGRTLHSLARRDKILSDVVICTALLHMYGNCGGIAEGENIFGSLAQHDVVSWNAMVSAYNQQGQPEKALQLYSHMEKEALSPDQSTFVLVFEACGSFVDNEGPVFMEFLKIGFVLHADASRRGFCLSLDVGNSLVGMYGKLGVLQEAECVFSVMCERDVVSWTMMLSAYVDQGRGMNALELFRQMQEEGVSPDQHIFVLAIQACSSLSMQEEHYFVRLNKMVRFEMGWALFADACKRGFVSDIYIGNALLSMYAKCVGLAEAQRVFVFLEEPDVVSWTTIMSAYVEHGQGGEALQLYWQMHKEYVLPLQVTFLTALNACGCLAESVAKQVVERGSSSRSFTLEIVRALHSDAQRMGFTKDSRVGKALVILYGRNGSFLEAEHLFNAFSPDATVWNTMLCTYVELGLGEEALCLYKQMRMRLAVLNDIGLLSIPRACAETSNEEMLREVHFDAISAGLGHDSSLTTLLHAYTSCGLMDDGQAVFYGILTPDAVAWNVFISGHAGSGGTIACMDGLERLWLTGLELDQVILSSILSASRNGGFIEPGLQYCASITEHFGVVLNLTHYGIMVDLLGHSGDFKKLKNMISKVPMQSDLTLWLSVLGACHLHGNLELAQWAFDRALLLEPMEAAVYVIMSNIYADTGLEDSVAEAEC